MALYYTVLGIVLLVLCLVFPLLLAVRKGYAWYLWVLPGLIGLIALAFLPHANRAGADEAFNRARRETGNIVGLVLSYVTLTLLCLTCISSGLLITL